MQVEWLTRDPFREYEIKKEETTRSFLTKDEIRLLMEGKLKNAKQELYRDLYLFCAFTGLSFADMRNLTEENIRTYFDEHEWINISTIMCSPPLCWIEGLTVPPTRN